MIAKRRIFLIQNIILLINKEKIQVKVIDKEQDQAIYKIRNTNDQ